MSHFNVEFGINATGKNILQQVPVYYGDSSRQAAQIIMGNSENTMPSVPAIACYISALEYDRSRIQDPYFVDKLQIRERNYDPSNNTWDRNQGNAFTVERVMPAPYKLSMKVDIWTSNTTQKLQLLEQICPLFNPGLEIQSTDNYIDWTSLSVVFLENTNWSSRQVPAMGATDIDIASLTFTMPIWISLPANVKKMGVIQKIVTSIYDSAGQMSSDVTNIPTEAMLCQRVLTPLQYGVIYHNNTLRLYDQSNRVVNTPNDIYLDLGSSTTTISWQAYVELCGLHLHNGSSEVRLEQPNGNIVVGTVSYYPSDSNLLLFTPYTNSIPTNSIPPINAIIDPFNMPVDSTYINALPGTRYLILNDIGSLDNITGAEAWHGKDGTDLVAKANDIIEFNGNRWFVAFAVDGQKEVKYTMNLKSGLQFKWNPEDQSWSKSIEGAYAAGAWSIVLSTAS
jgi:hypothetical protein